MALARAICEPLFISLVGMINHVKPSIVCFFLALYRHCKVSLIINMLLKSCKVPITLLHSERLKLYTILAFLSAIGLMVIVGLTGTNIVTLCTAVAFVPKHFEVKLCLLR